MSSFAKGEMATPETPEYKKISKHILEKYQEQVK